MGGREKGGGWVKEHFEFGLNLMDEGGHMAGKGKRHWRTIWRQIAMAG